MNGQVDIMAYWHALDLYSDYYDTDTVLNGDSGLISRDGICKPSFYAFQFINRLCSKVLGKYENAIVTTNGRNHFVIACHNYKSLSSRYVFTDEDFMKYIELCRSTSNYAVDVEVNAQSKIVSLSTCTNVNEDERFLLQGVLVEEK